MTNIRRFEDLTIEFETPGDSIMVIGDNGDGKSTVLRSLAMGLCDESSAAALFRELPGEFVRKGGRGREGVITVDLASREAVVYSTETRIVAQPEFERVEQKVFRVQGGKRIRISQDQFPWDRIFVSGYGAGIRTLGTADYDYYLAADAVYPLFRYDTPLQNPELVIRRLIGTRTRHALSGRVLQQVKSLLGNLLQLRERDQLMLRPTGIVVGGPWGWSELNALGDGYRATVTWVLDLLSWWFIKQEQEKLFGDRTSVAGIVLLDEVEQHLHPRWQRAIMRLLRGSFPRVQFIATTHSPLVASGCEDIAVHHLDRGEHRIEHLYGWLAEDVYEMMGIATSRAEPFSTDVLEQFKILDAKRIRNTATKGELKRLGILQAPSERASKYRFDPTPY